MKKEHRAPWGCTFAKEDRSKCLPGKIPKSDKEYFEILCLCVLQCGLNWAMIRKNWAKFKKGFYNFGFNKISKVKIEEVLRRPNVIRNKRKIEAIIKNAKEFQKIKRKYKNFSNFIDSLRNKKDKEVIKIIEKRFKHIGVEYFLHSIGYWK